jgi:hypothetical protein
VAVWHQTLLTALNVTLLIQKSNLRREHSIPSRQSQRQTGSQRPRTPRTIRKPAAKTQPRLGKRVREARRRTARDSLTGHFLPLHCVRSTGINHLLTAIHISPTQIPRIISSSLFLKVQCEAGYLLRISKAASTQFRAEHLG